MSELTQFLGAAELSEPGKVGDFAPSAVPPEPDRRGAGPPVDRSRGSLIAWLACAVVGVLAIGWFIVFSPVDSAAKAQ